LVGDVLLVVRRNVELGLRDHVVVLAASDGVSFREIREAPGLTLVTCCSRSPVAGV
jgi:hypothetical protein